VRDGEEEQERFVECSERTVLECGCGERLTLLGLKEDWQLEERTDFGCKECGQNLTLVDQLDEDVLSFRSLMRGVFKIPSG